MMRIYLSGPMSGLTVETAMSWVTEARDRLTKVGYSCHSPIELETGHLPLDEVIAPDSSREGHPLERREVFFHFDHNEVKKADIIYVNVTPLEDDQYSLGTDWEMAWGYEFDKMLVLVARMEQAYLKHPFIKACGAIIFNEQEEALVFLETYAGRRKRSQRKE